MHEEGQQLRSLVVHLRHDLGPELHFRIGERVMYGASAAILFELLAGLAKKPLRTRMVQEKPWGTRYKREEGG